MALFYAVLSGGHATLPLGELRGVLEALGHRYRFVEVFDGVALFRCGCGSVGGVAERSGMVREAGRVVAVTGADEGEIVEALGLFDWCGVVGGGDAVGVVFRRLRGYAAGRVGPGVVRRVAAALEGLVRRCGARVSPRGANRVVSIVVSEGVAVVGLRESVLPRGVLEPHRPQRRPFFHPGSLDPRLARVFVNLSRAAAPGPFVDPFCGTGGFALEAQEVGVPSVCGELVERLAHGAWVNLRAFPGSAWSGVVAWDAARLPLRDCSVQSIGTDPPYGRSISLRGRGLRELLEGFLWEAARVLRRGSFLAFAAPHWAEDVVDGLLRGAGLRLVERHYQRVHGSLTRIITVARKP